MHVGEAKLSFPQQVVWFGVGLLWMPALWFDLRYPTSGSLLVPGLLVGAVVMAASITALALLVGLRRASARQAIFIACWFAGFSVLDSAPWVEFINGYVDPRATDVVDGNGEGRP